MKKRIVALVCVLTMLLSLLPTTALADGPDFTLGLSATATVGSTSEARSLSELRPGDIVTVVITVPESIQLSAIQAKLLFDKDKLEVVTYDETDEEGDTYTYGRIDTGLNPIRVTPGWNNVNMTKYGAANKDGYVSIAATYYNKDGDIANKTRAEAFSLLSVELRVKESATVGETSFAIATGDENLAFSHEVGGVTTSYIVGVPSAVTATVVQELSSVALTGTVTPPTKGGTDSSAYTSTNPNVDVAVSWDPALVDAKFAANTVYTATVTVTPKTGYIWASDAAVTDTSDSGLTAFTKSGNSFVATKEFGKTDEKSLTGLVITACDVTGKTAGDTLGTSNLTVKATYDDGSEDANFTGYEVVYTNGTALERGDTSVRVKSGGIVSAAANFAEIPGKTAEASLFDFNAPALTYSGADQIDDVKSAAALKSAYTGKIGAPTITVKQSDSAVTEAKNAGSYDVYVSCAAGTVYDAVSDLKLGTVTISKANQDTLTINCANTVEFGSTLALTTEGGTTGGAVTYAVVPGGTGEATISGSTLTPTKVGDVNVTATMADNDNYNPVTSAEFTVTITQKAITGATVTLAKGSEEYTGSPIEVAVSSVVLGSVTLTTDDYDVSYKNNTNVGNATVTVTGKGNYTDTATQTFSITAHDISDKNDYVTNTADQRVVVGVGSFTAPAFKDTRATANKAIAGDVTYCEGSSYVDANKKTATEMAKILAGKDKGTPGTVSWKFIPSDSNYTGALTGSFAYEMVDIMFKVGSADATFGNVFASLKASPVYGDTWEEILGTMTQPVATVNSAGDGGTGTYTVKVDGADYTASAVPTAGDHTVTVLYTGTISGKVYTDIKVVEQTVNVSKAPLTITADDKNVTFGDDVPAYTVQYSGFVNGETASVLEGTLSFTCSYAKNSAVGTYDITPAGLTSGNYEITFVKGTLTVAQYDIKNATVTVTPETRNYTASSQSVEVTVKVGETTLIEGTDYTVEGNTATAVGTYQITVTGKGNYTGTNKSKSWTMLKAAQAALTISDTTGKTYGDADFTITVTGGSGTGAYDLTSSNPAVLSLTKNSDGNYTAKILKADSVTLTANKAGDDNYEAATPVTKTLTIAAKAIAESDFTIDIADKTYTGSEIEPSVTSEALVAGTDYTVAYTNNTNVGTATITITGKGNYQGTVTKTFSITAKSLADDDITVDALASYTYTGSAISPLVNVKWGSVTLVKDTDYTLDYSSNTDAGTATVTITGKGNYAGVKTVTFTINPAALTGTVTISLTTDADSDGKITMGDTLTASDMSDVTYQWYNNGTAITGATGKTYTVAEGDTKITVQVTASDANHTGSLTSAAVEVGKSQLTGTVDISGTDNLAAAVSTSAGEADYAIVWLRDGAEIPGATGATYALAAADKGHTISAKIVAKGDTYTGEVVSADNVNVPAAEPGAPVVTATAGNGSAEVRWTVNDNGSEIINYVVSITDGTETQTIVLGGNATSCTFNGLDNGTAYTVTVKAINGKGEGPEGTATVTPRVPSGGGSSGGTSTYSITVESTKNGTVTPSVKSARKGATVTLTVKPDKGFELDTLRVYDKDGNKIKVTEGKDGKYTFTMPASKVTVKATFAEIDTTWPFVDVADDFWARDAIAWAYENGYMNGNSTTTFNPGGSVTRQQLWMILARLSGERPASMAEAKAWAVENGISDGSNPGNAVSRQQMVTILYRYANLMGYKTSGSAALDIFPDSGKVAPYAQDAMAWSVANGIVGGTTQGTLNPAGTANRAQFATILQRFCKNIVEG